MYYRRRYPRKVVLEAMQDRKPCPYRIVEGPVPEDVWQASASVGGYDLTKDGVATKHLLRHPSGGDYLQVAHFSGGWSFYPAIDMRDSEPHVVSEPT
jgi:hypothetical protein